MKQEMKVVYVAGPFRPQLVPGSQWEQEQNIRLAEATSLEIWKMGAVAICPHTMTRFFQGAAPDDVWLKGDLELLRRCDAMITVGTWGKSKGTIGEYAFAVENKIPVFAGLYSLKSWLEDQQTEKDKSQ